MDWLNELLKGLENAEELQKAIAKGIGESFVSKADFNAANETKKKLETDLAERDTQLENLKEIDAEGLQAEITRLQGENTTNKEDYEKELKDLQLTNAIKLALNGKVHDEDIASQLIKKDELVISEDGKIVGLDEQLSTLQESKSFLFKQEEGQEDGEGGFQIGNPKPQNPGATDDAISAAFGNTEKQ